jgi:hypothetical protein
LPPIGIYGGITLDFLDPGATTKITATNQAAGITLDYVLKPNIRRETLSIIICKDKPIQKFTHSLELLTNKNLRDYVVDVELQKNILTLTWNRRQKPGKTLIIAEFVCDL